MLKIFQRIRMRRGAMEALSAGPAVTTNSLSQGVGRVADPLGHVAADVEVEILHGRVVAVSCTRLRMPCCTDSQIAQSCRFTTSQKSTASDGSKSACELEGLEQKVAGDVGALRRARLRMKTAT